MRPRGIAPHEFAPVFDWTPPRNRKVSLISFIAGSAILHALCFYVFQIVYPPTVALLPPPARVNIITPATEEGRVLLRWIEAEDPALSSTTQRPPEATTVELPKPAHIPSYASRQPALKEPPPYQPDLRVPSPQPPAPVPLSRPSPAAVPAVVATQLAFDDVAAIGAPTLPPLQFTTSSKEPPEAARFRVAISERGDVRHCFVESSSGDATLDAQARSYILRARFAPPENGGVAKAKDGLLWTTATVEWGNDIAADSGHKPPLQANPKP
jgi:TonB family protein